MKGKKKEIVLTFFFPSLLIYTSKHSKENKHRDDDVSFTYSTKLHIIASHASTLLCFVFPSDINTGLA